MVVLSLGVLVIIVEKSPKKCPKNARNFYPEIYIFLTVS